MESMIDGSDKYKEPLLRKVIRDDLRKGGFKRSIYRDFNELKKYFLTEDKKNRLENMSRFRRVLYTTGWLLKSLFLKLSPTRRILLIVAVILLLSSRDVIYSSDEITIRVNFVIIACFIMLFILMLELKDKLLAREELETGRAIQLEMMPERTPGVPGWSLWLFERTANEVGGDLVDFQPVGTSRYRIALADVAGKGLKAALLSAKLQATLRALASENLKISDLVSKVNEIFYRDSIRNMFASLVYLEIQEEGDMIKLVNAGHFPPLILHGNMVEELPKGDPGIGIFPELSFTEKNITLKSGEMIIIYSDGLIDAKNQAGEFYGIERFVKFLFSNRQKNAITIGELIIKELDNFVGDESVHDDISLAIIMRT